jgi:hypothetical membrane protein
MKIKALVFCGILSCVLYFATVALGGALWPGYSHMSRFISDLIGSGAPDKSLLDFLFTVYNALGFAFGLGVFFMARADLEHPRRTLGLTGATVLTLVAVFGFLTLFFPEDAPGSNMTTIGKLHIVMAGMSSLTSMACMLLLGLWLRGTDSTKGLGIYSIVSVVFVFLTGGYTAAITASRSAIVGLMERLTIGGFLQWVFVLALLLPRAQLEGRIRPQKAAA